MHPTHTLVFWTVRGMARPSVRIPDLGLVLVYGQEVEVPEERARASRDLSMAFTSKTVVRVLRPDLRQEPARTPDMRSRPPEATTPPPRPEVKAESAPPPSAPSEVKAEEGPPAWLADVLAQNKLLTAAVAQLTQQLESAPPQSGNAQVPSKYVPAKEVAEEEEEWPASEPVFFVPDFEPRTIQGDVSQTVKGEVSAGDSLAHSAALLSSLRTPAGRKRRRGGNPAPDSGEDT
jgi:hypothetical protein